MPQIALIVTWLRFDLLSGGELRYERGNMAAKRKTNVAKRKSKNVSNPNDPAVQDFVRGLIERGEAVKVTPGQELPPGATHEILEDKNGEVTVRRRRFSAV